MTKEQVKGMLDSALVGLKSVAVFVPGPLRVWLIVAANALLILVDQDNGILDNVWPLLSRQLNPAGVAAAASQLPPPDPAVAAVPLPNLEPPSQPPLNQITQADFQNVGHGEISHWK